MKHPASSVSLTLVLFAAAAPLLAQAHDHPPHEHAALGKVEFPVSCNAEAQKRFEHAMGVLHSFWWEEGDAAFKAVLQADSSCTMAWWGLALNAWGNPFAGGPAGPMLERGAAAAERAGAFAAGARTPRERGFLAAAAALYRNASSTPNSVRLQGYADSMASLYRAYPEDVEVAIYHALALVATASRTDTTFAQQRRAAAILNPLFARHPEHPGLAHYIIHANDSPQLAQLGLDAARRYAGIAPDAPHAQHMPSHIFVRLGLWDETVSSNRKAYDAGVAYAKATANGVLYYHEFHALDYAVYAHLQRGRDSAARALVEGTRLAQVKAPPSPILGQYNRQAMSARLSLERSDWKGAATFPLPAANEAPVVAALAYFTRGLGAARSGQLRQAGASVAALDSIAATLRSVDPYWQRVVTIKRDLVNSWIRFGEGDTAAALALAAATAEAEEVTDKHPITPGELLPARELEGDMLLATGRYPEARSRYQATLKREPGRARSTFGMARAAEQAHDPAGAAAGYRAFLELMAPGDNRRPELAIARAGSR
jgi:hypothetical protein